MSFARPDGGSAFVVHDTMADPRWLDPTVDPNERIPGTGHLGDPQMMNMSPVGLARFCTLRSWLCRTFEAIGHPDKYMYEIAGANHLCAAANQRDKLREAVGIATDWLVRHDFAVAP